MKRLPVIFLLLLSQLCSAQWDDTDRLTSQFHKDRRDALRALMPEKSVAIFFANPVRNRANDVDYQYHQDPNFYYLTGYMEPNAMVMIFKEEQTMGKDKFNEVLFVQERDPVKETWTGKRLGTEGARSMLQWQTVFNNTEFRYFDMPKGLLAMVIYPDLPNGSPSDPTELSSLVEQFKSKIESAHLKSDTDNLPRIMGALREDKQPEEMALLQKAIDITCNSFNEMMMQAEPGMKEYQIQAIGEYFFKDAGSEYPGYGSICGGGHNGCILHYEFNRSPLTGDDLMLVDMGAEYHGYTADVTRTFPMDGKFSDEERAIYQLVYDAQEAGFSKCKPGNSFRAPHDAAFATISKGLMELGIIKKQEEARKYFMHGTSHYLGLDVHDAGTYGPLKANSVITVEPGIYIPEGSDCDKKWWNKAVRIEDDVLITVDGYKNLSGKLPRSVSDIEKLMATPGSLKDFNSKAR